MTQHVAAGSVSLRKGMSIMNGGKYGRVLGVVLAGGKGERLMPLTRYRAKPAVYFAAKYRIIDFALSNLPGASGEIHPRHRFAQ